MLLLQQALDGKTPLNALFTTCPKTCSLIMVLCFVSLFPTAFGVTVSGAFHFGKPGSYHFRSLNGEGPMVDGVYLPELLQL